MYLFLLLAMMVYGCGQMGEMIQHAGEPTTETVSTTEKSIEEYQLEPYDGPKARVAVYRFQDQTAKGGGVVRGGGYPGHYWYNPQIGNGMADMLNDALLQSDRFIVLDRQTLKDVLQEQDLAASGRISKATGAPLGEIEGADLLIKGAITEFEPGSAGARGIGGLGYGGFSGLVAGAILGGVRQSHVAMVIQVVDARTSRLLFSTTVEGKANDFDLGGALAGFGGGFGGGAGLGTWQKTPVEKAVRIAILQAVKELSNKTPKTYFRHGQQTASAVSASAAAPVPASTKLPSPSAPKPQVATYAPKPEPSSAPQASTVSENQQIRHAQELLKKVGLDPGPVDGMWGNKTKSAITQFQTSRMNQNEAAGRLDGPTYAALKTAAAENWNYSAPQLAPSKEPASSTPTAGLPSQVFVKVQRATLLDAPGAEGKALATLSEGAKLSVQAEDKDCYFIVAEDGKSGWIYKSLTRK